MKKLVRRVMPLALLLWSLSALASEEAWNAAIKEGTAQFRSGDYVAALESFRRSIRASDDLSAEDPRRATSHNNTGLILKRLGRYAEAAQHYQRALELRERIVGPEHPIVASTLTNIGALKKQLGEYGEAERLYKRAVAIMESKHGPDHPEVCASLGNLAVLYAEQGRLQEALKLQQRAYRIRRDALGEEHADTLLSKHNLAGVYEGLGQYSQAETLYKQVLAATQQRLGSDHPDVASTLGNLAGVYEKQGQLAKAEPLRLRAVEIMRSHLGDEHPGTVIHKSNLAALYLSQHRLVEAEVLMKDVLAYRRKIYGDKHASVATAHNNLATLYRETQRHELALQHYMKALEINIALFGHEHPRVAITGSNIGAMLVGLNQPMAEKFLTQAIAVWRDTRGEHAVELAKDYTTLAVFYDRHKRYAEALDAIRKATDIRRVRASRDPHARSALSERAAFRDAFALHAYLLERRFAQTRDPALIDEGFRVAQLASGLGAAQALSQMATRFGSGSDQLAVLVRQRQDAVGQLHRLEDALVSEAAGGRASSRDYRREIDETDARIEVLDQALQRQFPRYRELASPQALSIAEAQALLRDDEVMLAYLLGSVDSFVWAIDRHDSRMIHIPAGRATIAEKIKRLRARLDPYLTADDYDPALIALARELHQLLVAPAGSYLKSGRQLLLALDGPLQSLPFGLLLSGAAEDHDYRRQPWLFRAHGSTVLPSVGSLRALRRFARASEAQQPFAGFGNPVLLGESAAGRKTVSADQLFDSRAMALVDDVRALDPLPETADELRTIAQAIDAPSGSLYLGDVATEATLKSLDLSRYRVLSFATHGLMSGDFSGLSEPALVLTPPERPSTSDDGLLTASEIAGLKLDADLVILSACNTAAADGTPGAEGFSGLTRAFFYAGSRSLMVSHWAVASDATVQLTTGMFAPDIRDAGPAQALRRSMQAYLDRAPSSNLAHPMYWAPFVIVGEGR